MSGYFDRGNPAGIDAPPPMEHQRYRTDLPYFLRCPEKKEVPVKTQTGRKRQSESHTGRIFESVIRYIYYKKIG